MFTAALRGRIHDRTRSSLAETVQRPLASTGASIHDRTSAER